MPVIELVRRAVEVPERYWFVLGVTAPKGGAGNYDTAYQGVHDWLRRNYGKADEYLCEGGCQGRAREWSWVHGAHSFVPLCSACHGLYDRKPKASTCTQGHNVGRWGRFGTRSGALGACKVCLRISNARREGRSVCAGCGYSPCRCSPCP